MAAPDRIHGKNGEMKMDPSGGVTAVTVASINKWDLDMSTEKVKVTCFGDPNHVYVQGLPDIKGTYAGDFDPADGLVIFDVAFGTVQPTLELLPSSLLPLIKFSGKALLDTKIAVDASGAVTIGGAFVAAGPWTIPASALLAAA